MLGSFRSVLGHYTRSLCAPTLRWENHLSWTFKPWRPPTQCRCSYWFNTYSHWGKQRKYTGFMFSSFSLGCSAYHMASVEVYTLVKKFLCNNLIVHMHVCVTSDCRMFGWSEQKEIFSKECGYNTVYPFKPWGLVDFASQLSLLFSLACCLEPQDWLWWWWLLHMQ